MTPFFVYPNVKIGEGTIIEPYSIIGVPPRGSEEGEYETIIGKNSHIRSNSVIYAGNKIGDNFKTGHSVVIREHNEIGNNVSFGTHCLIEHHIKIGNNVRIHGKGGIGEFTIIEDDVWIGPCVTLINALHPKCEFVKDCLKGPTIKKGVIIGAGVIVNPYITIHERAFIGSGSVVKEDVAAEKLAVGNPAVERMINIYRFKCTTGLTDKPYHKPEQKAEAV